MPGRRTSPAWRALARVAAANGITLVHVSSDYVFDGTKPGAYTEDDPIAPLGVYGQTKAAGDAVVATVPRHYIVRTSWVIGEGGNFVRTMASLAERGIDPTVVDDQVGRLTFTTDIARGIRHLLDTRAPYGVYNLTGTGDPTSWADVARRVFELTGHDPARVTRCQHRRLLRVRRRAGRPPAAQQRAGDSEDRGHRVHPGRRGNLAFRLPSGAFRMKLSVIGCGYLGAVHAAAMASIGHEVVGIDVDERKIDALSRGEAPFFEPGLQEILTEGIASGRLRFTTDIVRGARRGRALRRRGNPAAEGRLRRRPHLRQRGRRRPASRI